MDTEISTQMQEAFSIMINPSEPSFGKAGRAWTILMIYIQPALVDTADRLIRGTNRYDLESYDIPKLLQVIKPALLEVNNIEYASDMQLKEEGQKEIEDTINETYQSRLELAHNWRIARRTNKQYLEWAKTWKKLMEIMDHENKVPLISACNSLLRSLQPGYQPNINDWKFALVNTKMAVAARAYFLITSTVHPILLKYCEENCIILTNDRDDIKYILDNIKRRIELQPEFKDKMMAFKAIKATKDARDDLAHNKNFRERNLAKYREYFDGINSLYDYLNIEMPLRIGLNKSAKRLIYAIIP